MMSNGQKISIICVNSSGMGVVETTKLRRPSLMLRGQEMELTMSDDSDVEKMVSALREKIESPEAKDGRLRTTTNQTERTQQRLTASVKRDGKYLKLARGFRNYRVLMTGLVGTFFLTLSLIITHFGIQSYNAVTASGSISEIISHNNWAYRMNIAYDALLYSGIILISVSIAAAILKVPHGRGFSES